MNPQQPPSEPSDTRPGNTPVERHDFQPGQTISPRTHDASAPVQPPVATTAAPAPTLPAPQLAPAPPQFAAPPEPEEEKSFYNPGADQAPAGGREQTPLATQDAGPIPERHDDAEPVSWTASEFIAHDKSQNWYFRLGGVAAVVAAVVYFISRDIFSALVVVIAAGLFGVAASRQPRQLSYQLDNHGLTIGPKFYNFGDFRSFSIADDGPLHSINFMPLKRFAPPLAIYFDPKDEDRIVDVLAMHLPLETHKRDAVDGLMKRIRF